MATVTQLFNQANALVEQALGKSDIAVINGDFVSLGNRVFSSSENVDAFYKVLVDRIGRTVLAMRAYTAHGATLKREGIDWGVIMQKLSVKLPDSKKNPTWNAQSEQHSDPFEKAPLMVKQKLFSSLGAWEVDGTIPDVQLHTAFLGAAQWGAFVEVLFMAMYNRLALDVENLSNFCRATFIARKSKANADGKISMVNILTEYNTATNKSLTLANCKYDKDFLRFLSEQIMLYMKRMERYSVVFNNDEDGIERFTPRDKQVLVVHADIASAITAYLQSDTYHENLVGLGDRYEEVPYWQASDQYDFETTSKVAVELSDGGSAENVEVNGVVAILYDIDAMGITIDNRRTKSIYNPKDEYTNYFMKAEMGFYNDLSENAVVFYLAET